MQFKTNPITFPPIWAHYENLPTRSRMTTVMRSVTHRTALPILPNPPVVRKRETRRRRRIRKERRTLLGVRHRRITSPERRTPLVLKTKIRSSKAFPKHYGKSAGSHQSV